MTDNKNRIWKFFSFYKPYYGLLIADIFCAIVVSAIALYMPLLIRYITKDLLEGSIANTSFKIYETGIIMLVLVLVQTACMFFFDYKGHAMGAMMEKDIRFELFDHIQTLPFKFFDENKTGKLMSTITNDLLSLTELYHHGPEDLVVYSIKFIGAIIILVNINIYLAFMAFITLPIMFIFTILINKKLATVFKYNLEKIGDVNAQIEENLSGIRIVKSFANEEVEKEKFNFENNKFLKGRINIYKTEAIFSGGINILSQVITIIVVVYGAKSVLNYSIDLADLIAFLLYVGYLVEPIVKIAFSTNQFQEGIAGFNRMMDIMDIKSDIRDSENAIDIGNIEGRVSFIDVGFKYKEDHNYILKDISFNVDKGEYVAIVGSSGIGKTTLCSLIPRFYEVSQGKILIDDINIKDIKLKSLRKNIGVVQQEVYLFAGTIFENICYGKPNATKEDVIKACKKANAHEFIMELEGGYNTDIGPKGVKLSGGQRQRLSIARVFLKDPKIIILDEATSALDNESEIIIKNSIEKLAEHRTMFVIAHRLSTIRQAKRIMVLNEYGICEEGTHEELIKLNGEYSRLYSAQ